MIRVEPKHSKESSPFIGQAGAAEKIGHTMDVKPCFAISFRGGGFFLMYPSTKLGKVKRFK